MLKKTAMIFGISGQDGSLLARFLIKKGYKIIGVSRKENINNFSKLKKLKIYNKILLKKVNYLNYKEIYNLIKKSKCEEIYLLAGQSSVFKSFKISHKTVQENLFITTNVLESIKNIGKKIKLYHAGSSEVFGDIHKKPCNEKSTFYPKSPYALSKVISTELVKSYRENLNLWVVTGILFNHESSLRPNKFVLKKIVNFVKQCSMNDKKKIELGNINIVRDWGLASEFVELMWKILQLKKPEDFVIASGKSVKLKKLISYIFKKKKLNINENLKLNKIFLRPSELLSIRANTTKAQKKLNLKKMKNAFDVIDSIYNNNY